MRKKPGTKPAKKRLRKRESRDGGLMAAFATPQHKPQQAVEQQALKQQQEQALPVKLTPKGKEYFKGVSDVYKTTLPTKANWSETSKEEVMKNMKDCDGWAPKPEQMITTIKQGLYAVQMESGTFAAIKGEDPDGKLHYMYVKIPSASISRERGEPDKDLLISFYAAGLRNYEASYIEDQLGKSKAKLPQLQGAEADAQRASAALKKFERENAAAVESNKDILYATRDGVLPGDTFSMKYSDEYREKARKELDDYKAGLESLKASASQAESNATTLREELARIKVLETKLEGLRE